MIQDIADRLTLTSVLPNASLSATNSPAGVALPNYIGSIAFLVDIGAVVGGTSPTISVQLSTSATLGGTYTAVGSPVAATTAAGKSIVVVEDAFLLGYVKAVATITGSPTGYPVSVSAIGQTQYT